MSDLLELREEIEKIDDAIIQLMAKRQSLAKQVGQLKAKIGQAIFDSEREKQLALYHENLSITYGLQPEFVKELFNLVMAYSRKIQE